MDTESVKLILLEELEECGNVERLQRFDIPSHRSLGNSNLKTAVPVDCYHTLVAY